jgi:hypothetical protein
VRQARFAAAIVEGKPALQAAKIAGYSDSYAHARSYELLELPAIRSLLGVALEQAGIGPRELALVLAATLGATKAVTIDGQLLATTVPDHRMRLRAYDRIARACGLVPRVPKVKRDRSLGKLEVRFHPSSPGYRTGEAAHDR